MSTRTLRWPLILQVVTAGLLFGAALYTLWLASSNVVDREERRASAVDRLQRAGDLLAAEGRAALARIRPDHEFMAPDEWAAIARQLDAAAAAARGRFPEVDGGYYLPGRPGRPFEPAFAERPPAPPRRKGPRPPPGAGGVADYVDTQADAAYRKKTGLLVVEDIEPDTVAIRAIPVTIEGRTVAACWTTIRLADPIFLDHPTAAYRLFVALATAGIATSTLLTANLAATIRRQRAERDRLQQVLRRSERLAALGKLLAGVAHEVRNPLTGIRSTAQLWQRGLAVDAESIGGLIDEVDRLELIVANLLQFSRADGQPRAAGDLGEILVEAARLAKAAAAEAGVAITVDRAADLPAAELAAPAILQILRNLTANALQAMPRGGSLRLRTGTDPARRTVSATVADEGGGLSEETLAHLFEPFYTTRPEGTGLGLAIAREIALAHGGDLHAANRHDGPGTIFTLSLPALATPSSERPA